MTNYITQRQAKRLLKQTGRTLKEIAAMVEAMPTEKCGQRDKVHITHVNEILDDHRRPPMEREATTIRPLCDKHIRAIRAQAETTQVINGLRNQVRRQSISR